MKNQVQVISINSTDEGEYEKSILSNGQSVEKTSLDCSFANFFAKYRPSAAKGPDQSIINSKLTKVAPIEVIELSDGEEESGLADSQKDIPENIVKSQVSKALTTSVSSSAEEGLKQIISEISADPNYVDLLFENVNSSNSISFSMFGLDGVLKRYYLIVETASNLYEIFDGPDMESKLANFICSHESNFSSQVFLIAYGCKSFSSNVTATLNKEFRRRLQEGSRLEKNMRRQASSWNDFERSLWNIALMRGVKLDFLDSSKFPAPYLDALIKKIYKLSTEARSYDSNFCLETSKRCGSSSQEIWSLFLQEVGRITPTSAAAIQSKYPTLRSLMEAYSGCASETDCERLLENITTINRCLGPSLSKRVYHAMTSVDKNKLMSLI